MSERATRKRKYQHSKCKQCRKDRQACEPVDRVWPEPCFRCAKYSYQCSENRTLDEEKDCEETAEVTGQESKIARSPFKSTSECLQDVGHLARLTFMSRYLFQNSDLSAGMGPTETKSFPLIEDLALIETAFGKAKDISKEKAKQLARRGECLEARLLVTQLAFCFGQNLSHKMVDSGDAEALVAIACAHNDYSAALESQWRLITHNLLNDTDDDSDQGCASELSDLPGEPRECLAKLLDIYARSNAQVESIAERYGLDSRLCLELNQPLHMAILSEFIKDDTYLLELFLENEDVMPSPIPTGYPYLSLTPATVALLSNCPKSLIFMVENNTALLAQSSPCPFVRDLSVYFPGFVLEDGTLLHYAVAFGTPATMSFTVELLLDFGADINAQEKNGWTPLHVAVARNHPSLVDLLLDKKANANLSNLQGATPYTILLETLEFYAYALHDLGPAELKSLLQIGNTLLDHGANLYERAGRSSSTILHHVAALGESCSETMALLGRLADKYHDLDPDPMAFAAGNGALETVRLLVAQDLEIYDGLDSYMASLEHDNVDLSVIEGPKMASGSSVARCWIRACFEAAGKHPAIVQEFLDRGVPVDSIHDGNTLLQAAIRRNRDHHTHVLSLLTKRGATINTLHNGCTPLHIAVQRGWESGVSYLLQRGAEITTIDKDGYNCLTLAARWEEAGIMARLLDTGIPVATPDAKSRTALHLAVQEESIELLRLLLPMYNGAPLTRDDGGKTALDRVSDQPLMSATYMRAIFKKWGYVQEDLARVVGDDITTTTTTGNPKAPTPHGSCNQQ